MELARKRKVRKAAALQPIAIESLWIPSPYSFKEATKGYSWRGCFEHGVSFL